jgi:hypothetical protein
MIARGIIDGQADWIMTKPDCMGRFIGRRLLRLISNAEWTERLLGEIIQIKLKLSAQCTVHWTLSNCPVWLVCDCPV